jgi:hypothetical protein
VPVVQEGTDAVTAVVANPSQTLPSSSAGVVSSYTGSGTTIQIYEGGTLLTFTTGAIGNSKYTIGTPTVSPAGKITVGADQRQRHDDATVADHSAMDNATDKVTITYPVLVQKSGGQQVSLSLTQVITKAKTGTAGLNTALVYIYQRSATAPAVPSTTATYTFATGGITGLNNGWTATVPAGSNPLYVTVATASASTTTDTIATGEWASPVIMAQDGAAGAAGLNVATVFLFQRTASASAPTLPSTTATYTFSTGVSTGQNNGWTQSMPSSGGAYRWMTTATAVATGATDTIANTEWAAASLLAQDGATGATGPRGVLAGDGFYWGIRLGSNSAWDDQLANRVIKDMVDGVAVGSAGSDTALATTTHLTLGDKVSLGNGPPWQACRGSLTFSTSVWSSGTNYAVNAYVTRTGGTYRALLASGPAGVGSKDPVTQPTYWQQVYANTTWRPDADYVQNEYVIFATASAVTIKRALKASGPGSAGAQDPGTTTGSWMDVGTAGTNRTSWAATTVYAQFDYLTDSGTVYFGNFRHTSGATSLSTDQTAQQVSITRTWNGVGWVQVLLYVDGNAVIIGTMSASVVYGGILSGMGISIGPNAEFQVDAVTGNVTSSKFTGYNSNFGNTSNPTTHALTAQTYPGVGSGDAGRFVVTYSSSGPGAASTGCAITAISYSHQSTSHAIRGTWNKFGTSSSPGRGTNNGLYSSGLVGVNNGNAFYAEAGTIGPFTGSHECVLLSGTEYEPGDIVVDTECVARGDLSNTLWHVEVSSEPRQFGAVGIIIYTMGPMNRQGLLAVAHLELTVDEDTGIVSGPAWFEMVKDQCDLACMNALGEGQMNVCGEGGRELRGGDLIVTSSMRGKGMRQALADDTSDDIVRSYTVARVRGKRSVVYNFRSATDWKRVPVIFISG